MSLIDVAERNENDNNIIYHNNLDVPDERYEVHGIIIYLDFIDQTIYLDRVQTHSDKQRVYPPVFDTRPVTRIRVSVIFNKLDKCW